MNGLIIALFVYVSTPTMHLYVYEKILSAYCNATL